MFSLSFGVNLKNKTSQFLNFHCQIAKITVNAKMLLEQLVNTWSLKAGTDEPLLQANVGQHLGILKLSVQTGATT